VSSAYENVPQRIGNAERDAAVERLRVNLDEGRLDQPTYETRVATALAATTQDDLAPLFQDLAPVVSSNPTYELYPHQSVAMPTPSPYLMDATSAPVEPSSMEQPRMPPQMEWFNGLPVWAKVILVVVIVSLMAGLFRFGGWWVIFFFPAIFGRWGRNGQYRNTRNRRRPY
jgi:hypothetical protein